MSEPYEDLYRECPADPLVTRAVIADKVCKIPDPVMRTQVAHALGFGGKIPRSAWFPDGEDGPFAWFEMVIDGQSRVSPDGIRWGEADELPSGDWAVEVGVNPDGSPFRLYRPGGTP